MKNRIYIDGDLAYVELTQGQEALINLEDVIHVAGYRWYASWNRSTKSYYARTHITLPNGKQADLYLHRLLLGLQRGDRIIGDHINRNSLDNRRKNLRIVTTRESVLNRRLHKNNTSGYRGVYKHAYCNKWQAKITHNYKLLHLGLFDTPQEAAKVYNDKAKEIYGNYASLNAV